jgi:hypothetical protein
MRVLMLSVLLAPLMTVAARADDMAVCNAQRPELLKRAESFTGDAQTKKYIDRALRHAGREQAEGDGDECVEALDHAAKLLASKK